MSGLFYQLHMCKKEKLQQFQDTPVRKRDSDDQDDEFVDDADSQVEGLRVDSRMTTKNRILEASMKRNHELATGLTNNALNSDLMKNIIDQNSLKALAANPELTN